MDQIALVEQQLDDGARLITALKKQGFDVSAACWMKSNEDEQWYLYIASSDVGKRGAKEAYRDVHDAIRAMRPTIAIDPFELRLVAPADPLVPAIDAMHHRYPAPMASRLGGGLFAGRSVEGAYIYPRQ